MRCVYLIRHGELDLPDTKKRCYSRTELSLSPCGIEQGKELCAWARTRGIEAVYTSPLGRCRETAALMASGALPVHTVNALHEVDVGEWEGLTFDEIRERWPTVYAARGNKMSEVAPPGGESFYRAAVRFNDALQDIMSEHKGNLAVVAHSGVIRSWLFHFAALGGGSMFSIPVPYAGIAALCMDGNTLLNVTAGTRVSKIPTAAEIEEYYLRCNTPEDVIAHCRAVADKAGELVEKNGITCNRELLRAACLLHDICRADGREHPQRAAQILTMDGYPALAGIISAHHDLPNHPSAEMELLYLSDKLVAGTQTVPLEARFSESYKKCTDDEAKRNWERRRSAAEKIVKKYRLEALV